MTSRPGPESATATAPFRIRSAVRADLPEITEIYGHHVRVGVASFEEIAPTLEDMTQRYEAVIAGGFPYVVATDAESGQVIGYAYASPYRTRPAYRNTVENSVYMAPDATGRGAGRALLAHVIEACAQGGWRQMIAVIGDSNNTASINLHARLGFHHAGVLKSVGFKHGRWIDTVLMQLALGPGDTTPGRAADPA